MIGPRMPKFLRYCHLKAKLAPSEFSTATAQSRHSTRLNTTSGRAVTSKSPRFRHAISFSCRLHLGMVGRPPALFPGIFPLGNQGIGGVGTEPNSQATAHSRSLLHAGLGKSRFLASESQHAPPKYTISQDCSDDRMVQSQRLCALRDGNPRFCFKRSLDRGSDGDDRGFGSKRQRLNSPDLKFLSVDDFVYDPPEDTITAEDTFGSHRHTRSQVEDRERPATRTGTIEMGNGDEDEAVRCICGYEDYPGPPPIDEDSKHRLKDSTALDPIFATDLTDDAAGFFVQCDLCKVWQHGACVGIKTEESSPDEYFCEQCRKDFHKTFTASNRYVPLFSWRFVLA